MYYGFRPEGTGLLIALTRYEYHKCQSEIRSIVIGTSPSEPHRMVVFMRSTVPKNLRCESRNPPIGSVFMRSTIQPFPKIYVSNADSVTKVAKLSVW